MKFNIWYISAYDQPKGHSSRTYDFATEFVRMGHDVTLFTNSYSHFTHEDHLQNGEKYREEVIDGVRVVWLKSVHYEGNGWRRAANMLCNAWRAFTVGGAMHTSPDVIFGPSVPLFTGLAAYLLAQRKGCPFVFEVRDIWPQALIDLGLLSPKSPVARVFRALEVFLYKRASHISAVLPLTWRHVENAGVSSKKVSWIPNGANFRRFADCAPYEGGKPGEITAMYLGGFSSTHSVQTILQAAKILQNRGETRIRLILIGRGRERAFCEQEAERLKLERVEFRDMVPKDEVPALQQQADVLISSVKDTPVYQFGINSNKIYDYLVSGRPILFAGKAPKDPVSEGNAGLTSPPEDPRSMADALTEFIEMTPDGRRELGSNGQRYARDNFDLGVLARRLEEILKRTITVHPGRVR